MPGRGITLVTLGDPTRRTGGYLYNARVLAALRARGAPDGGPVDQLALPEGEPTETLREALAGRDPGLVILDSVAMELTLPLLEWLRGRGTRTVGLMHMLPSAQAAEPEPVRRAERQFLRRVDVAIAVSPDLARQLVDAGAAADRVRVVLPGRDSVPILRRRVGPPGLTRFLVVANWTPNKGIHWVVDAFARLRTSGRCARLDLVGTPDRGAYGDEVRRVVAARNLAAEVRFWGILSSDRLAQRYADADVFVLPSRSEGFGIVYAEALSHGLPVIASRVGPIPWLVPEGCGILVSPDDRHALAAAMIRLAGDSELSRRMGVQARRRARQLPTWRESEEEFCDIVGDVLRES